MALREGSPISLSPPITKARMRKPKFIAKIIASGKRAKLTEGDDHKWLAADTVRNLAGWNVDQNRNDHLNSDQCSITRSTETLNVGDVKNCRKLRSYLHTSG